MTVVSIMTDFGEGDDEALLLKGVIWNIAPKVKISDLSHAIPAQDIAAGSRMLGNCCKFFPPGTIYLAVVDPGVGTKRRGMAARLGTHYYVGPDNGLFTELYRDANRNGSEILMVSLTDSTYWLEKVNPIFHGRDVFAPVTGHIAAGVDLREFGPVINDPVLL